MISQEHISVQRTARYYTMGEKGQTASHLWIVFHGYGQLAYYFLRKFEPLLEPGHFFAAPEGLNRFYLEGVSGRVGASWMTKEDRENEINDYLNYLDHLYSSLPVFVDKTTTLIFFGFSQGVSTACRWAMNRKIPDKMILWGGFPPLNSDQSTYQLPDVPVILRLGSNDPYREDRHKGIIKDLQHQYSSLRLMPYEGGHRIHPEQLKEASNVLLKM